MTVVVAGPSRFWRAALCCVVAGAAALGWWTTRSNPPVARQHEVHVVRGGKPRTTRR